MRKLFHYVGVQYPEADISSIDTLLDIPITGAGQKTPIPLRNIIKTPLQRVEVPAEINHITNGWALLL